MSGFRPPEHYVHGVGGPVVVVPGRVADWLERHAGLRRLRTEHRGADPEVDGVLVALGVAAAAWRDLVGAPSRTDEAHQPEHCPPSVLTTGQAADLAGVTPRAILRAITEQRLPAEFVGRQWMVTRVDVEHYRAARQARGAA